MGLRFEQSGTWTAKTVDCLRQLWVEGYSASEISRILSNEHGVVASRNAVISKVHRIGLPGRPARAAVINARPARAPKPRKPAEGNLDRSLTQRIHKLARTPDRWLKVRVREVDKYLPVGEQLVELPPDQSPHAVTFAQLTDDHCRWPLGDPSQPDFMFCGATRHIEIRKDGTHHEKPYCARHCRVAYASPRAAQTPAFIDRGSMRRFA